MPGTGTAGQPLDCVLVGAGVMADLGARIEDHITRQVVAPWRPATAGVNQTPALGGTSADWWAVTFPAAPPAGIYLLVWRTQLDPPLVEIIDTITVTATDVDASQWRPTSSDVARVVYEYTRHAFTLDEPSAGSPHGVFDENTTPTAAAVNDMITAACHEIAGRVGVPIPPRHHDLARQTGVWHVAAFISQLRAPAGTQDQQGEYQALIQRYGRCVDDLISLCRTPTATRLA